MPGLVKPAAFNFGPPIGLVELESKPFGFGNCDTIRKRIDNAHLPMNGSKATIEVEWTMVSIGSKKPLEIEGIPYDVKIMLTPGLRSTGRMEITRNDQHGVVCGTFTSSIFVKFSAVFINRKDPNKSMVVSSYVIMFTKDPGKWSVKPYREDLYRVSSANYPEEISNIHESLRPNTYDFYQVGALFEGEVEAGGMLSAAVR